jgi:hypothetical protein
MESHQRRYQELFCESHSKQLGSCGARVTAVPVPGLQKAHDPHLLHEKENGGKFAKMTGDDGGGGVDSMAAAVGGRSPWGRSAVATKHLHLGGRIHQFNSCWP